MLSIHRIVQAHFKYFLSLEQRQKSFNNTVALIYDVFPKEDTTKGQLYEAWETCQKSWQSVKGDRLEQESVQDKTPGKAQEAGFALLRLK